MKYMPCIQIKNLTRQAPNEINIHINHLINTLMHFWPILGKGKLA